MMNTVSRNIPFPEPKLMKKYISIHSEDRDTLKYKSPSEFTIYLPDPITNVCSVRVKDVIFPKLYIFSEDYHNTQFKIINGNINYEKTISLNNAKRYTVKQLLQDINTQLNGNINIQEVGDGNIGGYPPFPPFVKALYYHNISNKFIFTGFTDEKVKFHQTDDPNITDLKTHWGFGYYLGFDKTNNGFEYFTDTNSSSFYDKSSYTFSPFNCDKDIVFLSDGSNDNIMIKNGSLILPSNRQVRLNEGRREVYMEIDGLNSMDEIDPISNKAQFYRKNSAITKIPLPPYTSEQVEIDQRFFENKTEFKTPIDKLYKCSFRFRYHDGTLIDFHGSDLSFTLEFEYLS